MLELSKRVLLINSVLGLGSTGNIVLNFVLNTTKTIARRNIPARYVCIGEGIYRLHTTSFCFWWMTTIDKEQSIRNKEAHFVPTFYDDIQEFNPTVHVGIISVLK